MRTRQLVLKSREKAEEAFGTLASIDPNLVLVFGSAAYFTDARFVAALARVFPTAVRIGCSTAGEISNGGVNDGTCVVTAVRLEKGTIRPVTTHLAGMADSLAAGERIGAELASPELRAVMVFGPGVKINGSALVEGIARRVGENLPITGGLAGDGTAFQHTFTLSQDGVSEDAVVAAGLSGDALVFTHGSFGGWDSFGPPRKVTRSDGNVLFELDGEAALDVYKRYLGKHAEGLPASGLLFPFAMLDDDHDELGLIRTILGVDAGSGSLTLAGAIRQHGFLKLMHSTTDRLVSGAEQAAEAASAMQEVAGDSLAVLVSCVGRKLVMGDRVDEEVEAVGEVFGKQTTLAGFYSYGEICPFIPGGECRLHNQTMTITRIGEQ